MSETCPAARSNAVCTFGPEFGPCAACYADDQANELQYGIPMPDYEAARNDRMAQEIIKLRAAVKNLSAAQRRGAK